jgi:3',5'-nucleoside bisphosphate phosphatase
VAGPVEPAPERGPRPRRHDPTRPAPPVVHAPSVVDLHTHTTRSDGVLEPDALIAAVAATTVRTLAITDHDSLAGYRELVRTPGAIPDRLTLIPGVEINALARGIPGVEELHVLGFGMDPDDEAFEAILATQRAARRVRFERVVARLREIGLGIDAQIAALDLTRDDALGRPTIGRALMAAGHAKSVEDAFQRLIGHGGPAYVPREGLGPAESIRAIRSAGGLPSLAHFWEAPNQSVLLWELREIGLAGLEVHHSSFLPETVAEIGAVAAALELLPTGGSDYHGDTQTYAEAHASLAIPATVEAGILRALERSAPG